MLWGAITFHVASAVEFTYSTLNGTYGGKNEANENASYFAMKPQKKTMFELNVCSHKFWLK